MIESRRHKDSTVDIFMNPRLACLQFKFWNCVPEISGDRDRGCRGDGAGVFVEHETPSICILAGR